MFFILSGLVIVQSLASFSYRPRPFLIARVARIYPVFLVVFAFAVAVQPLATGFERMAWIGPDSPARLHLVGRLAERLGCGHRHASDDDARAVPERRAARCVGRVPRRRMEPVDRVAVLPAGAADRRAPRGCAGLAWLFLALSAAAIAWQAVAPEAWQFSRAFLPNKAQYFALGIVSAILVRQGGEGIGLLPRRARRHAGAVRAQGGIDKLLPPLVWTACLAAQLRRHRRAATRTRAGRLRRFAMGALATMLQSRPLVWLGAVSYCIYLVNEPVQKLLGVTLAMLVQGDAALFTALWMPGAVVLPMLAAWWLHERIEVPALRRGRACAPRLERRSPGQRRMNVQ